MSRIRVETPAIDVVLRQTIARNQSAKSARYSGTQKDYSLNGFLSEDSSVTCSRMINGPHGSFQLVLADRGILHGGSIDSLYGLVEPMDVIEIRMAQRPYQYGGQLPLVFRGIVSEVRRDEAMGQDGKPRRNVVIAGQDWGKILQIIQDKYIKGNPMTLRWMSSIGLQSRYDIDYSILTAGELVSALIKKVGNPFIEDLGDPAYPPFLVDVSGADPVDKVMPQGVQNQQGGTLWSYLSKYGDVGPLYEMFIEDTEEAPKLIYRKPPFSTADGDPVYGAIPEMVNVEARQVTRIEAGRSDADVANWYWIEHPRTSTMDAQKTLWTALGTNPYSTFHENPNCSKDLYGIRTMEIVSNHGFMTQGAPETQVRTETENFTEYNKEKIRKLKLANQDNVVFENGSIVMQGNERVKIGMNVRIQRGKSINLYYAQRVSHSYLPFRTFTTTVGYIRGTGFINRSSNDQLGIESPYLEEIGRGVYE